MPVPTALDPSIRLGRLHKVTIVEADTGDTLTGEVLDLDRDHTGARTVTVAVPTVTIRHETHTFPLTSNPTTTRRNPTTGAVLLTTHENTPHPH